MMQIDRLSPAFAVEEIMFRDCIFFLRGEKLVIIAYSTTSLCV